MKGKRVLCWFTENLRLHDNEMLWQAATKASAVLPVYIIPERWFKSNALGFPKSGAFRLKFLLESLTDLKEQLKAKQANLLVLRGEPSEIINRLVKEHNIQLVVASTAVTAEEWQNFNQTEKELKKLQVPIDYYWQNTLYQLNDIPWPIHRLPENFTAFRKEAEQEATVRQSFPVPDIIPFDFKVETSFIPSLEDWNIPQPISDVRTAYPFRGGESAALQHLKQYIWEDERIATYKETRNELIGTAYSSKLSAWLAVGSISPRYVYEEIKKFEEKRIKNDSTYWLIFELMWRDYFRFAAKKYGNAIFLKNGIRNKKYSWQNDVEKFEKWRLGKTGERFIDANMRELLHTGFMSNRGRQNVACYLAKDLKVNWTWGAAWFESQLIDYDVCSNWLNWAYIAGVGNDPREDRYFNTESQVRKYDPKGLYMERWLGPINETIKP
ncbi:MAG: DASH family cryptochrome [Cyclobacteriaceae bacterium]|nr:DASH family cryptochrome [Cyclobacteriaceae bacterium]